MQSPLLCTLETSVCLSQGPSQREGAWGLGPLNFTYKNFWEEQAYAIEIFVTVCDDVITMCVISTLCLKKGTRTLSIVTLRGIDGFSRFFCVNIPDTAGHQMALQIPTYPTSVFTLPGKTEQKKYALKWTTNVKKLEIGSHKILITAVWAHEVHRLVTYCSTSCYQTCHWWHVHLSPVERRTSASAREAIQLLECETSDFISPDLWSPTALTSIQSITSSRGHATAGLSDDVQECGWTQEATIDGWNLDWSGAEHYWHCYQRMRETVCMLVFAWRADISNIDCSSWTTGHLDKLSARVTEM